MTNNSRKPQIQSNEDWQRQFEALRKNAIQAKCGSPLFVFRGNDSYVDFICGVLETIRTGNVDYCFFIYQIEDLLKFEKDQLQSRWLPEEECFMVWLSGDKQSLI